MKEILTVVFAGTMILSMTACSASETKTTDAAAPAETTAVADTTADTTATNTTATAGGEIAYEISVLQLVQHATFNRSNEGFFAALDDARIKYEADQQSAAGGQSNCQTITGRLVNDKDDLILAIATPAAQATTGVTTGIPILLAAVTDPAESGLMNSNDEPGVDVSGTPDLTPVSKQIDLTEQLIPNMKNVGILYCSTESSSILQTDMAKATCNAVGLTYKDCTVPSSSEIQTVVESMVSKVDVIYAPTDSMMTADMATVAMIVTDDDIPVICGEASMVEADRLTIYSTNYFQLGYLTGQQTIDILVNGADVAKTPVGYLPADKCALTVNKTTADVLGIDITGLEGADVVE